MNPMNNNNNITIKTTLGDDCRRFSAPAPVTYAHLLSLVKDAYAVEAPVLKYLDAEGDTISVSSDVEVAEACRLVGSGTLRVLVLRAQLALSAPAQAPGPHHVHRMHRFLVGLPINGPHGHGPHGHGPHGHGPWMDMNVEELSAKYRNQLQVLTEMGLDDKPRRSLWLLNKFDGDLDTVVARLLARQQEDAANVVAPHCGKHGKFGKHGGKHGKCDKQAKRACWAEKRAAWDQVRGTWQAKRDAWHAVRAEAQTVCQHKREAWHAFCAAKQAFCEAKQTWEAEKAKRNV